MKTQRHPPSSFLPLPLLLIVAVLVPLSGLRATGIPLRGPSLPLGAAGGGPVTGPDCTVIAEKSVAKVDGRTGVVGTVVWLPRGQSIRAAVWKPGVGLCYALRRMGRRERGFTQIVGTDRRAVALVVTALDARLNDPRLLPGAVPVPGGLAAPAR